ncbi:kinase-like domain-containing protein [Chytridium lagenaria]|nr:kinase-like domain-containing protein [Chytridium lagenaria]
MSSSNIINNNDYILDKSSITSVSKEPLGQGGNGAVYKAKYGNDDVVVKKYRPDKIERHAALREEFQKEARVLNSLRHPGIVFFFGLYDDDGDQLAIVLEYMNLGDLFQYYTTKPKLPFSNRLSIIMDIAAAMQYLHNNNNVHQDLKSPNVLLQIKENRVAAKITDFGTPARLLQEKMLCSPSFTSDVYAFGVIISEVMTWVGPFGVNTRNIRFKLSEFRKSYHSITLPPNASIEDRYGFQAIRDLMFNCLDLNPDNRPIFREINQKLELIKEKLPDPVVVNLPKTDSIYSSVLSSSTTAYTRSDNKPLPPPIIETTYVRKDSGQTRKIRICIIWTVVVIVLLGSRRRGRSIAITPEKQ